ncbi:MAG: SMC-Scp complex subunit ScpB [Gammaproteobacteria bacterium]|nr:SMC-Scp complex subunit ScpB [Gammaproteobacteria bacterium]
MTPEKLKSIIEAALFASERPLSVDRILGLFQMDEMLTKQKVKEALHTLQAECAERGLELIEVSTGYRYQVRQTYGEWINRMFEERAPRYSRALLETLALICYKQPITRAEVEDVRGVAVSTNIIRTLLDREWVKLIGHRDVPGKPALYGTTRKLLDDLNLKKLDELPPLAEIRDIGQVPGELNLIHTEDNVGRPDNESNSNTDPELDGSMAVAPITMVEGDEVDVSDDVEHVAEEIEDSANDEDVTDDIEDSDSVDAAAKNNHDAVVVEKDSEASLAQAVSS